MPKQKITRRADGRIQKSKMIDEKNFNSRPLARAVCKSGHNASSIFLYCHKM